MRQDLDILIQSAQTNLRAGRLAEDRLLPYTDVTGLVFGGLRSLLDAQVAPERRPAALVRLRKYAGLVGGYEPITAQAMRLTRDRQGQAQLLRPAKSQVERDLVNGPILIQGLEKLFDQYKVEGLARTVRDPEAAAVGVSAIRARGDSAGGAHGFSPSRRPLRARARTGGRGAAARTARADGAAGVYRDPGRDAASGAGGGQGARHDHDELS